jgi:hypothetical protein
MRLLYPLLLADLQHLWRKACWLWLVMKVAAKNQIRQKIGLDISAIKDATRN